MMNGSNASLENALARTEQDTEAVLRAATTATGALKRLRKAAKAGDLRDLRSSLAATDQALTTLRQRFTEARDRWDFDEDAYFANGSFVDELLATAGQQNLSLYAQDERLYSYPVLLRVLPNDRAVTIDGARERRIRPSVLVSHLRDLQRRPPRFRPEAFLESLFQCYTALVARHRRDLDDGMVVRLTEVYDLLTLLPGQSKEYSRQEFARDIYLLDQSGVTTTRRNYALSLPASSGTRSTASTIKVITQDGEEKLYFGLAFTSAG